MQILTQFIPFALMTVYLAVTVFLIVLASRFVTAHERIASAFEDAARSLRRPPEQKKDA